MPINRDEEGNQRSKDEDVGCSAQREKEEKGSKDGDGEAGVEGGHVGGPVDKVIHIIHHIVHNIKNHHHIINYE